MKALKAAALVIVIIASLSYSLYAIARGPCRLPRAYAVGAIDGRFGISDVDLIIALRDAEAIWEEALGVDLFTYEPEKGRMPVSLIYDERQELSSKNRALESKIEATERSAETIRREFESLKRRHGAAESDYAAMRSAYEAEQARYNSEIRYWNDRGGAPEAEYRMLEARRAALESSYDALESKRLEVNGLAAEINAEIARYNYLVDLVNEDVEAINQSADKEFEQGEYTRDERGERIDIYEFKDRDDLVRVIAHELGHALGSGHNDDPDSIMYYLNSSDNLKPTADDAAGVKASCRLD